MSHWVRSLTHIDLIDQPSLVAEFHESVQGLVQGDQLAHPLGVGVVAVANVDGAGLLFFGADH